MESSHPPRSSRKPPLPVSRALRDIGSAVTAWRKLRGMTQVQLADRAGISRHTVRRLENADGAISLENTLRILRALGVLDAVPQAIDPYQSDVGRLRSDEQLPQRVRPQRLSGRDDG
jgi:transcriptional regulator with XRE-family HTH domain